MKRKGQGGVGHKHRRRPRRRSPVVQATPEGEPVAPTPFEPEEKSTEVLPSRDSEEQLIFAEEDSDADDEEFAEPTAVTLEESLSSIAAGGGSSELQARGVSSPVEPTSGIVVEENVAEYEESNSASKATEVPDDTSSVLVAEAAPTSALHDDWWSSSEESRLSNAPECAPEAADAYNDPDPVEVAVPDDDDDSLDETAAAVATEEEAAGASAFSNNEEADPVVSCRSQSTNSIEETPPAVLGAVAVEKLLSNKSRGGSSSLTAPSEDGCRSAAKREVTNYLSEAEPLRNEVTAPSPGLSLESITEHPSPPRAADRRAHDVTECPGDLVGEESLEPYPQSCEGTPLLRGGAGSPLIGTCDTTVWSDYDRTPMVRPPLPPPPLPLPKTSLPLPLPVAHPAFYELRNSALRSEVFGSRPPPPPPPPPPTRFLPPNAYLGSQPTRQVFYGGRSHFWSPPLLHGISAPSSLGTQLSVPYRVPTTLLQRPMTVHPPSVGSVVFPTVMNSSVASGPTMFCISGSPLKQMMEMKQRGIAPSFPLAPPSTTLTNITTKQTIAVPARVSTVALPMWLSPCGGRSVPKSLETTLKAHAPAGASWQSTSVAPSLAAMPCCAPFAPILAPASAPRPARRGASCRQEDEGVSSISRCRRSRRLLFGPPLR